MNYKLWLIILPIICYLFGSINWAVFISALKGKNIRKMGSGNPGTLNMSRNLGLKFGLLTFFLDVVKGALPTLVAFFVFGKVCFKDTTFYVYDFAVYLCGLSVVLGHIYPIYFKFKGGKGIASTIGVFLVAESIHGGQWAVVAIMALIAAALFIYFTEFGAMGSFIAITPPAVSGSIRLFLQYGAGNVNSVSPMLGFYVVSNMMIFAICLFTWFAHRKNIERMLSGDEHPTSFRSMVVKAKMKKRTDAAEKQSSSGEKPQPTESDKT